ncbi:MAG TPA: U32 family peptidase [Polyangiaceae bacterium]|nr:U32 family peptidase [Polyangiaceae bacterium]
MFENPSRPEVLAPAGDQLALDAAIGAGADAVYFGVDAFNARARAQNFTVDGLQDTVGRLHERRVKAHLTLNTLVFDSELDAWADVVRAADRAGVDAVIVQDLGAVGLVRRIAPNLRIHASTQMTCTDVASVEFAASLGADRVVLARELSLADIEQIARGTRVELEVFVHGALCIAYSGQCLTSEAIGGRSANRGACAQACRLPYELLVDGVVRDLGERAYLLSPQDLEASASVPRLIELGVRSFKIEGRLKGPEYVAATTRLYRTAVDQALGATPAPDFAATKQRAIQSYSRGSGPGFLAGVNHQQLVEGRSCDHRGLEVARALGREQRAGKSWLLVEASDRIARGDGLLIEGGWGGEGETGGRVWGIEVAGADVNAAPPGSSAKLWFGPELELSAIERGRRVFRTHDPEAEREINAQLARQPYREALALKISGRFGEPFSLEGRSERGRFARVGADVTVEPAQNQPTSASELSDKLGRLGDSPFAFGGLEIDLPSGAWLPVSALNRARRALVSALTETRPGPLYPEVKSPPSVVPELSSLSAPPPAGLFTLCRNRAQAEAALAAGSDGVYLDFLELTGTGSALRELRASGAWVGVAPPRIRKPGEEKIDRYLEGLTPDAVLVRSLGALFELEQRITSGSRAYRIGDFSLNVSNRLTALEVLSRGLSAFTPSFDLDSPRLLTLLSSSLAPYAEVVLHHPMPLFHMEHCVIAALLSDGRDHLSCGRPCDRHQLSLRDRANMDHPVEADVGCRNTVFHASAQSAAELVPALQRAGVARFRLELVRESAEETASIVRAYRDLLAGRVSGREIFRNLRASGGYGVVRGSLRVLSE